MRKFCVILVCLIIFSSFVFSGCNMFGFSISNDATVNKKPNLTVKPSTMIDASQSATQEELLTNVSPAVVGIGANYLNSQSIGTGVCIDSNNYVLTNNHVVEGANTITLYLFDGSTCFASIVWRDSSYDLAILKASKTLPYLKMVDSGNYSAGEEVIAIGTPLALAFKHSATKGIISATNRTIAVDNDYGQSTLNNLIQHDASINPGNSGGPLINMKGEVIGINTVKVVDAEGMGFAIPVDTVHPLIKNINADGFYDTAYMGVFGYDAHLNKIGNGKIGYYVQSVDAKSPAQMLGLQKGDIILKIDNISITDTISLRKLIYQHKANDKVFVEYERNGKIYHSFITLSQHPCSYKSQVIPSY